MLVGWYLCINTCRILCLSTLFSLSTRGFWIFLCIHSAIIAEVDANETQPYICLGTFPLLRWHVHTTMHFLPLLLSKALSSVVKQIFTLHQRGATV